MVNDILASIGGIAFTLLTQQLFRKDSTYSPVIVIATGIWGTFMVWEQLTAHDDWKVIRDEH